MGWCSPIYKSCADRADRVYLKDNEQIFNYLTYDNVLIWLNHCQVGIGALDGILGFLKT